MTYRPINLAQKFSLIDAPWSPKVIAQMNDYEFKLVRLHGDFVWHDHADTDETFIVFEGEVRIDFPDGTVTLGPGEMFVVPRGLSHKPYAPHPALVMLIEPAGVVNTGQVGGALTAPQDEWI